MSLELIQALQNDSSIKSHARAGNDFFRIHLSFSDINLLKAHRFPMLATGILWTRKGAELILSQHKKVEYPYDNYLRMALTNSSNGLSVKPAIVWAADVTSDIEVRSAFKGRSRENRSNFYLIKKQL